MLVDIYRDEVLDKILIVEDGKGIPRISGKGSQFLKDLTFQRQVDFKDLPTGLQSEEVMASLKERGFYAARQTVTVTEVEIQD
ncbi:MULTISPECIES: hypothetical protein [unclassified Pseudomonas]|uniref:hypothetical protein n=1 Tax=unclassified Pseudomonas TaxID=196821 RepID=UPI000C888604|nr:MULTISPECIES: hypothetical protein [unclassified Pseudomonas]PNA03544.1 hypothetical protein C1X28_20060 [Pseudomonas sp. FW305-BF15]PNB79349.1 hypothetical protein C1X30_18570 [Pseudomonas sp. FW305-BF6]